MNAIDAVLAGQARRGDELPIEFSAHAVKRFASRSGRGLGAAAARHQLSAMLAAAVITTERPSWTTSEADAWLVLGDVAQPLVRKGDKLVAVTTIHNGLVDHESLANRQAESRDFRQRKSARRKAVKHTRGRNGPRG